MTYTYNGVDWNKELNSGRLTRRTHHPREFKRKMKVALRQAEKKFGRSKDGEIRA